MKKILSVLLIGMMLMGMLAGCAKKEAFVEPTMQLDMVQMVETAKGDTVQKDAPTTDVYTQLAAPEHCQDELVSEKGWLKVHVDADVQLPDTGLPMVRLASREITLDEIKHYAEVLFDPEVRCIKLGSNELMTKGYWKLQIDELQYGIDHWKEFGELKYDLRFTHIEEAKAGLAEWTKNMENAPDTFQQSTPVYEWSYGTTTYSSGDTTQTPYFALYTTKDDARFSILQCDESYIRFVRDNFKTHGVLGLRKVDVSDKLNISIEDAYEVAEQTVAALGIDDLICTYQMGMISDNNDWYGYDFIYEREINGVPITFVNYGNDFSGREFIRITVNDEGVATLDYHFPKEIKEEITANATLLSFDQIKSVFDRMVMVVDNQTESEAWNRSGMPDLTVDYYIKEIRLGLAPVEETGDSGKTLLVPAWDFIGYRTAAVNGKAEGSHDTNEKTSFLTINAVDGSVIIRNG